MCPAPHSSALRHSSGWSVKTEGGRFQNNIFFHFQSAGAWDEGAGGVWKKPRAVSTGLARPKGKDIPREVTREQALCFQPAKPPLGCPNKGTKIKAEASRCPGNT